MDQQIDSAALYCDRNTSGHVSVEWLEGALDLLKDHELRVREYSVENNPVCAASSYNFEDKKSQLFNAVRTGALRSLYLYANSRKRHNLIMDWEARVSVDLSDGDAHLGLPESCGVGLSELLRHTYLLNKPLAIWNYGIGYSRRISKAPCMYAVGILGGKAYLDPNETDEDRDRVGNWFHELRGDRRHLSGYLRDVYPANLLSAKHVNARLSKSKTLLTTGCGEFTSLDERMWLWTVPDMAIPKARAALRRANLLICP